MNIVIIVCIIGFSVIFIPYKIKYANIKNMLSEINIPRIKFDMCSNIVDNIIPIIEIINSIRHINFNGSKNIFLI